MSLWMTLLLAAAPFSVFSATPSTNIWWRLGRLLLAGGLTYVCMMLVLGAEYNQSWKDYNQCYTAHDELRDMSPERNEACRHHLDRVPDSTAVFALLFGWIPAAGYVGFWELVWRIYHRKKIKALGKDFKGRWFSNIIILFFFTLGGYILYKVIPILYYVAFKGY